MSEMNFIKLCGTVISEPVMIYVQKGTNFYESYISCKRTSGIEDVIKVVFPDHVLEFMKNGERICFAGAIESRIYTDESGVRHTPIYVRFREKLETESEDVNIAHLVGIKLKKTAIRETPLTKNKICDFCLAVESGHKYQYIPCISWNKCAIIACRIDTGKIIGVKGRLQSRTYTKRYDDGTSEEKSVLELSVFELDEMKDGGE